MGVPSHLAQAVARYRRDVARGEAVAMAAIHAAYEDARPRVQREIDALIAAIEANDEITNGQAIRLTQLDRLLEVIDRDLSAMGRNAESLIKDAQSQAIDASLEQTRGMAVARAVEESDAAAIARNWVNVPRDQLEHLIGSISDGSPLRESLSQIGPDTAGAVRKTLADGIVRSIPTKQLGASLAAQLNLSEARAQTIARTSVQQAARNTQLEQMAENADILDGWEWFSALDARTCLSCIANHGRQFPLSEQQFPAHPNCRCTAVPVLSDYPDQGIGPSGEEWFAAQPDDVQDAMLPVWARDEYRAGRIQISDFAQEHQSANYGRSFHQATRLQAEANAARRNGGDSGGQTNRSPESTAEFASLEVARERGFDQYRDWAGALTKQERDSIEYYQSSGYHDYNQALRAGTESGDRAMLREIKAIDEALKRAILDRDVTVYRGSSLSRLPDLDGLQGTIISDKGFVSTSLDERIADKFVSYKQDEGAAAVKTRIVVREGSRAAFLDSLREESGGLLQESELLLPRGTRFRVTAVNTSQEVPVVDLEVIND